MDRMCVRIYLCAVSTLKTLNAINLPGYATMSLHTQLNYALGLYIVNVH